LSDIAVFTPILSGAEFPAFACTASIREYESVQTSRNQVRWCCQTFRSYCEEAGQRGFGIIVEENEIGPAFLIQFRSIDPKNEQAFKAISTPFPVSLVAQTGLLFCPWCGKNLRRRYEKQVKAIARPDLSIPLK
jgi:hypothetical protein